MHMIWFHLNSRRVKLISDRHIRKEIFVHANVSTPNEWLAEWLAACKQNGKLFYMDGESLFMSSFQKITHLDRAEWGDSDVCAVCIASTPMFRALHHHHRVHRVMLGQSCEQE